MSEETKKNNTITFLLTTAVSAFVAGATVILFVDKRIDDRVKIAETKSESQIAEIKSQLASAQTLLASLDSTEKSQIEKHKETVRLLSESAENIRTVFERQCNDSPVNRDLWSTGKVSATNTKTTINRHLESLNR